MMNKARSVCNNENKIGINKIAGLVGWMDRFDMFNFIICFSLSF